MLPADYPHLPLNNFQQRNPWIYDDQQDRRNFGEPLNQQDEILTVWGPDQYELPAGRALFELACVGGFIATAAYFYSFVAPESPAVPRSYPFNGLREELGNDANSKTNTRPTVRIKILYLSLLINYLIGQLTWGRRINLIIINFLMDTLVNPIIYPITSYIRTVSF
ncbi:hypothetical protein K502DRAFT_287968 [Neoconidiobolus thromboides FSU 785]|nr:hypothetical protein K502DRAFT_287968 [Neoconidiobolus thromboides FSU 785]